MAPLQNKVRPSNWKGLVALVLSWIMVYAVAVSLHGHQQRAKCADVAEAGSPAARQKGPFCSDDNEDLPVIYVITPTYYRVTQRADLIRLSNTLSLVPRVHWVVVEDSKTVSENVRAILERSLVWKWTQINADSPSRKENPYNNRGVNQRNAGISHVVELARKSASLRGVVYFADDDNTYDIRLFEEMRYIQKVGCWAVGFSGGRLYERCTLDHTTGKVNGFVSHFMADRTFAMDMAAFAINLACLMDSAEQGLLPHFTHNYLPGYLETKFIQYFIKNVDQLEPKGNCTEIMVWHTRTETRAENTAPRNEFESVQMKV